MTVELCLLTVLECSGDSILVNMLHSGDDGASWPLFLGIREV